MRSSRQRSRAGLPARVIKPHTFSIWERARNEPAVILSKDEDFVDHWILSAAPVRFVWIRKGNCSNQALLTWLEPMWADAVKRLEQGEKFIELRP